MANVVQSAISSIRKKADEVLNDNQGWFRGGKFTPVRQVSEFRVGDNPTLGQAVNQVLSRGANEAFNPYNAIASNENNNAFVRGGADIVNQGLKSYINTASFGLVQPQLGEQQTPYGTIGKVAGTIGGFGASPLMKPLNFIDKATGKLVTNIAPRIGANLAGKAALGLTKELAQTAAYTAAQAGSQALGLKPKEEITPKTFATNLILGSVLRGATSPQVTNKLSKVISREGLYSSDIKNVEDIIQNLGAAKQTGKPSLNLETYARKQGEIYNKAYNLMPEKEWRRLSLEDQFKMVKNKMLDLKASGEPIQMGFAQQDREKLKKVVEKSTDVGDIFNADPIKVQQSIKNLDDIYNGLLAAPKDKDFINKVKALRARLNEQQFKIVGADTGAYKTDYAILQQMRGTDMPQAPLLDSIERKIADLDEIIANKGVLPNQLAQTATELQAPPKTQLDLAKSSTDQIVDSQASLTGNIPQKPSVDNLVPSQSVSMESNIPAGKAKIKVPGEKTPKQKSFLESVAQSEKSSEPLIQQTKALEQSYTPITNKQSISQAKSLIKRSPDEAKNLVFSDAPVDSVKITTGIELAKQYEKQGNINEAVAMINELDQQLRRAGQGIQAASLWNKMSPETLLRTANRIAENSKQKLPQEVQNNILTRMRKVSKMAEGAEKDNATMEVLNYIADNVKPTIGEIFDSYRYTNLLSNPRTHERNIYGNLFNTLVTRPLDIALNATYDFVKNPTNPMARDVSLSDVPTYYKNVFTSLGNAFDAAKEGMKAKNLEFDATGAETAIEALRRERVPGAFKVIPKFMQAQDQFFSTLIASGEKARLLKKGLSDEQASTQAKRLAEKYLLREKLGKSEAGYLVRALDSLGSLAMSGRKLPVVGKLWSWFVPFVTTPINFAKMSVEHSLFNLPGAKMNSENLAKATAGSLFMAYAGKLAMEDRTTLAAPTDSKQKELFYASGKKPFSVKIGDTWVPLNYFGPFGLSLMVPAAVKQRFQDDPGAYTDDVALKATRVVGDISKYLASQTPLQGIGSFVSLLDGDSDFTAQSIMGSMATQAIPLSGMNRWVNSVVDDIYRKGYDFKSQILKSIPGGTFNLEAYTNPTGEPTKRLPENQFIPYDIGRENQMYAGLEQQRKEKLQANREENLLKKQLEQGKLKGGISGDKVAYINENGTPTILDLSKYDKVAELPSTNKYQQAIKESKQYAEAAKILNNTSLSQEQQQTALARLGISPDKASYYQVANDNDNLKTMFVLDAVNRVKTQGGGLGDVVSLLANQRTEINGKMIASNGVLDNLVDEGIISKAQAIQLKKYKFENGQLVTKSKSGTKAKKISVTLRKMSAPKLSSSKTKVKRISVPKFKKLKRSKLKVLKLPSVAK